MNAPHHKIVFMSIGHKIVFFLYFCDVLNISKKALTSISCHDTLRKNSNKIRDSCDKIII